MDYLGFLKILKILKCAFDVLRRKYRNARKREIYKDLRELAASGRGNTIVSEPGTLEFELCRELAAEGVLMNVGLGFTLVYYGPRSN